MTVTKTRDEEYTYEKYVNETLEMLFYARGLAARYQESLQAIADGAVDP